MKTLFYVSTLAFLFLTSSTVHAETIDNGIFKTKGVKGITVAETFKVYGNCGVCKKNIESAVLSLKGVKSAEWDPESKIIEVIFVTDKVTLDDIKKKLAEVGYDTDTYQATEAAYNKSTSCCHYERPKK